MNVCYKPVAHQEAIAAADWHDQQRFGLGNEFLAELAALLDRVAFHPQLYGRIPLRRPARDIREGPVHRFDYHVVYEVRGEDIVVIAVAHNRRRPFYWKDRLADE